MMEAGGNSFMKAWQRVARRIRVPLGFAAAAVYLWQLVEHRPQPARGVAAQLCLGLCAEE